MKQRILAGLCMLIFISMLVGCVETIPGSDTVHIYGYVEDKYGNEIKGIKVICEGTTETTDASGRFSFYIYNVDYSQNVELYFTGTDFGFAPMTQKVWISPGTNSPLGGVTMQRNKALVKGEVIMSFQSSIQPLDATVVNPAIIDGPAYPEGELIVKFKDGIQTLSADESLAQMDLQVMAKDPSKPFVTMKTTGDLQETIAKLEARPDVEYAEPNYYIYPANYSAQYNDPERNLDSTWNLEAINLNNAWYSAEDSSNIYVAVLDSGLKHGVIPNENILWELGRDFVDGDDDPSVRWDSHGTQVADIIYKVANGRVKILPIRILSSANNDETRGTLWELLQGLEYALNNADIINLSVSVKASSSDLKSLDDLLWQYESQGKMKLILGAAGNDGYSVPAYPAASPYVLSVGAVGPTLQPASYSNRGVDLYAPGGDYDLYPQGAGNTIKAAGAWVEGTSLASAHVAGVAAMVLAENRYMSVYELQQRLVENSLIYSYTDGGGLIDALGAVKNMDPQRPLVFFENNDNPTESCYTYYKDGANYFEMAAVDPGYRLITAWVDRDLDGAVSRGDWFSQQNLTINKGDIVDNIELRLEVY